MQIISAIVCSEYGVLWILYVDQLHKPSDSCLKYVILTQGMDAET
jgi:hypothetical protein